MSTSQSTSEKGKFNWDSTHAGKLEYHQFWYKLISNLENSRLSFAASPELMIERNPGVPFESVATIKAEFDADEIGLKTFSRRMKISKDQLRDWNTFQDDSGKAISILKLLFAYGSAPMSIIENQCAAHRINHERWNRSIEAIRLAYEPDQGEDVQVLRQKLYSINDKDGFSKWQQQFIMTVNRMHELNAQPTDDELDAIVKKSILNRDLIDAILVPNICKKTFAWRDIIVQCDNALEIPHIRATQKDLQPASSTHTSSSAPSMESLTRDVKALAVSMGNKYSDANNHAKGRGGQSPGGTPGPRKCGKCLRSGHKSANCTESTCSLCNGALTVGEWHTCSQRPESRTVTVLPRKVSTKRARSPPPAAKTSEGAYTLGQQRAIKRVRILAAKSNEDLLAFLAANPR